MPDLERKILEWRRQMLAAGIAATSLVELENHLREDIERQCRSGMTAEQAFGHAVQAIGPAAALKKEFRKMEELLVMKLVQMTGVAFLVITGFFSLMVGPKLFHHDAGATPRLLALAALTLAALSWRCGHRWLPVIPDARVRAAVGASCCVVAFVGLRWFVVSIVPDFLAQVLGAGKSVGWFCVSFLGAFALLAILGSIGPGLEKAARASKLVTD